MWIVALILISVGLLVICLGFQIKNKQKITLIHDYHWKNVKNEDIKSYTSLFGIGQYTIGISFLISGILGLLNSSMLVILPAFLGIVIGFVIMYKAQKKYNLGMF